MYRKLLVFLFSIPIYLTLVIIPAIPAALPTLGVSAFEAPDAARGQQIADVFLTDLARTNKLHLVERAQMDKAIKELALAQTGLVDAGSAARVGKLVGAQKLVVGSMVVQGTQVILTARLVDVATGRVEAGENIQGSADELFLLIHQLANRFHRRLTGEWIPSLMVDTSGPGGMKLEILQQIDPARWAHNPESPLQVVLEVNKGAGSTYKGDETLTMSFHVDIKDAGKWGQARECYVTIYDIDAQGKIYLLFPNHWVQDNKVTIGKVYKIPDDTYELGFVGDPGEERFVGIATRQPLDMVDGQKAKIQQEGVPEVNSSAHDFGTRGVVPKMKKLKPTDWGAGQVQFFREK